MASRVFFSTTAIGFSSGGGVFCDTCGVQSMSTDDCEQSMAESLIPASECEDG
jgi:hypothetical protein